MEIRLRVDRLQPPTGQVRLVRPADPASGEGNGQERQRLYERPFTGWLELLAALSDLMGGA